MVATHIKKIKHSVFCVIGVYLRDITNTIYVILYLNVSHESSQHLLFLFMLEEHKKNLKLLNESERQI